MKRLPIEVMNPEGGEPLYLEEGTGLWLTGPDFAQRNECDVEEILAALRSDSTVKRSRRTIRKDLEEVSILG